MPKVDVCYAAPLIDLFDLSGKVVVVIDILRATSNINAALHFGATMVHTISEVEDFKKYNPNKVLFAAERNGQKLEGFKYGNSPQQWMSGDVKDKALVLSTTNGTRCVNASLGADIVVAGSFTNLSATREFLIETGKDVILFCAGWKKRGSIEDLSYAGAMVDELALHFDIAYDSAALARDCYLQRKDDLVEWIKKTHYYTRISKESLGSDLEYCFTQDLYDFVSVYEDGGFVKRTPST